MSKGIERIAAIDVVTQTGREGKEQPLDGLLDTR